MRYRVDELAVRAGLSVDTVRFYQTSGLLPPPQREGRVAWYDAEHLARLERVRDLKAKGLTLQAVKRLLAGEFDAPDEALVEAVVASVPGDSAESLTLAQLAERTGMSPALLEALEREGLLAPTPTEDGPRYGEADANLVTEGLALLETGLPLSELLALARRHDEAMRNVAEEAVDLFVRFVRDPIRARAGDEQEAATQLVDAFRKMLPATTSLVAHHFQRVLLKVARARIEEDGSEHEIEAVQHESMRGSG
ncbi:MAG: MerR family transcriptional regulator [Actinomycetota bacterium]